MPRKSLSQKPSSSKKKSPTTTKNQTNRSLSQPTLKQSFSKSQLSPETIDKLVNKCVRYVLYRAGSNLAIRKPDVQNSVLPQVGRHFDTIIDKATEVLKNIYGLHLYVSDQPSSTKQYLVGNKLPYKANFTNTNIDSNNEDQQVVPSDVNKILIMLVLTHVFMSNNNVNEASLFSFLRSVKIDPNEKHELFGNVKDFVTSTMVKQKYLRAEIDVATRRVSYLWGPRAQQEISKHEILKFVCKVYKDRTPQSWSTQYESAKTQNKDDETEEAEAVQNESPMEEDSD